jgi:transcriptional regulator of arginine metabolism
MRNKAARQAALVRLANEHALSSQGQMVRLLRELGFKVTQASISRDVRDLGLVRVNGRYLPAAQVGRDGGTQTPTGLGNELIVSIEPIGANLIVVRTPVGSANALAVELDQQQWTGVAGTLAGDDTIFVAVRSRSAQGRVLALLRRTALNPRRAEN